MHRTQGHSNANYLSGAIELQLFVVHIWLRLERCVNQPDCPWPFRPLFIKRVDVLSLDLVQCRSREIWFYINRIILKFDRHLGSAAADVPVKFQGDWTRLNPNLGASILHEISVRLVNRCPGERGQNWVKTFSKLIVAFNRVCFCL